MFNIFAGNKEKCMPYTNDHNLASTYNWKVSKGSLESSYFAVSDFLKNVLKIHNGGHEIHNGSQYVRKQGKYPKRNCK